jgi:hypothetical protein
MHIALYSVIGFSILAAGYSYLAYNALTDGERLARGIQLFLLLIIAGCIGYVLIDRIELPPQYELQAIDVSGDIFIAGSGNSCNQAYRNAVYPDNVQSVACRRVN